MKTTKTFENWYTTILEEVASPTKSLAGDVDAIINSLDILVKELTEELDAPEFNEVNEADGEGPSKVWQWIWWMPKARRAQQKVNKIKLNVTDMEGAATDAPDAKQQAKINAKAKQARDQAEELQKMVDDKYGAKGELVKRALSSEKIAGQIASIKRATGLEDNPEKIASYKEKMAELQVKYKEDQAAIAELEPSEDDKNAEIARKKEEKEKQDKLDADAESAEKKKSQPKSEPAAEPKSEPAAEPNSEPAAEPKSEPKSEPAAEPKSEPAAEPKSEPAAEPKSEPKSEPAAEPNPDDKNTKEGKLKRLEDMLAKAKESGDEEKIKKVQDLIDRVSAKESWQLNGTILGMMLESEITKLEMTFILNESRYQNLSIKDRFSRLL